MRNILSNWIFSYGDNPFDHELTPAQHSRLREELKNIYSRLDNLKEKTSNIFFNLVVACFIGPDSSTG